jgi:hypothetical protein
VDTLPMSGQGLMSSNLVEYMRFPHSSLVSGVTARPAGRRSLGTRGATVDQPNLLR